MTKLFYQRELLALLMAVITVVLIALNSFNVFAVTPGTLAGHTVNYYFSIGVMFYHWLDRIHPARRCFWWLACLPACLAYPAIRST